MTTPYEIPLSAAPQKITIALAGVSYQLVVKWNAQAQVWVLDMLTEAGIPVIMGIPLVTGANLLEQYDYLDLGGQLIAQSDQDLQAPPSFDNLGTVGHLYFVTTP